MTRFDLEAVQERLRIEELDAWLLFDFRRLNPLACEVLHIPPERFITRRWFYLIPAEGEPVGIVPRLEPEALLGLPGKHFTYLRYDELRTLVKETVNGMRRVAMEYAPHGTNPYVSRVDGGTLDLVRAGGVEVVSSADLVQYFQSLWPDEAYPLYRKAAAALIEIKNAAFERVRESLRDDRTITEQALARWIMNQMSQNGLVADEPIVAVGVHTGDPHYHSLGRPEVRIERDQPLMIDLFTRVDHPDATVADFTYMAWTGPEPDPRFMEIWDVARTARDTAVSTVRATLLAGERLEGWQVDRAARTVVDEAGFGEAFIHRTGHSLGRETHGSGVHADDLEMRDERAVIPGVSFTVEPGIYLPEFGVRTEVNVLVQARQVEVFEEPMQESPTLLA
jgi:Xaa-Pro aminopeptidase